MHSVKSKVAASQWRQMSPGSQITRPKIWPFAQQMDQFNNKGNIKTSYTALREGWLVYGGLPAQRASNTKSVSMLWHHHIPRSEERPLNSGYGFRQCETTLHCNVVSHWLSLYPEWSLVEYRLTHLSCRSKPSHWRLSYIDLSLGCRPDHGELSLRENELVDKIKKTTGCQSGVIYLQGTYGRDMGPVGRPLSLMFSSSGSVLLSEMSKFRVFNLYIYVMDI